MRMLDFHCGLGFEPQDSPPYYKTYIVVNHNHLFVNVINVSNYLKLSPNGSVARIRHFFLFTSVIKVSMLTVSLMGRLDTMILMVRTKSYTVIKSNFAPSTKKVFTDEIQTDFEARKKACVLASIFSRYPVN